jgi:hypothetical protein
MIMGVDQKILERFDELLREGKRVSQTRTPVTGGFPVPYRRGMVRNPPDEKVDSESAIEWGLRCLNLLKRATSVESDYYKRFQEESVGFDSISSVTCISAALAVLRAAKSDYENGELSEVRLLIEAEVFDDFLEQASNLLSTGYYGPAAVIAGIVLEEGLRRHCNQNGVAIRPKAMIGEMNDSLAKSGLYNNVMKQKIATVATIRNHAAHGQWSEFDSKDVEQMIDWVQLFMENSFGSKRMPIR